MIASLWILWIHKFWDLSVVGYNEQLMSKWYIYIYKSILKKEFIKFTIKKMTNILMKMHVDCDIKIYFLKRSYN